MKRLFNKNSFAIERFERIKHITQWKSRLFARISYYCWEFQWKQYYVRIELTNFVIRKQTFLPLFIVQYQISLFYRHQQLEIVLVRILNLFVLVKMFSQPVYSGKKFNYNRQFCNQSLFLNIIVDLMISLIRKKNTLEYVYICYKLTHLKLYGRHYLITRVTPFFAIKD